jgi:WD40 repeat protein
VLALSRPSGAQGPASADAGAIPIAEDVRRPDLTIRVAEKSGVSVLTYTRDDRFLATSAADHLIRLWNAGAKEAASEERPRTLSGHTGRIRMVFPGSTPETLISIADDQTVKTWNATSGRLLRSLPLHFGKEVHRLAIGPGRDTLLATSRNNQVTLWNYVNGQVIQSFRTTKDAVVLSLAFSPDARFLAVGTNGGVIQLRDAQTGTVTRTLDAGGAPHSLGASLTHVAAGLGDGSLKIWPLDPHAPMRIIKGHRGSVNALVFDGRGDQLTSASADGTLKVWDVGSGSLVCSHEGHVGEVLSVALSVNGQKMASGGADGTARVWTMPPSRAREPAGTVR